MQTLTEESTSTQERDVLKEMGKADGPVTLEDMYERLDCSTMPQKHRLRLTMTSLARKDRLRIGDDGTYDLTDRKPAPPGEPHPVDLSEEELARRGTPDIFAGMGAGSAPADADEELDVETFDPEDSPIGEVKMEGVETVEDDGAGEEAAEASKEPELPLPEFLERELWGSSGPVHRNALAAKATAAGYDVMSKTVGLMLTRLAADGKIRAGSRAGTYFALSEAAPAAPAPRAPRAKRKDPLGDYLKAELAKEGAIAGSVLAARAVAAGLSKSAPSVGLKLGRLAKDGEIRRPKRGIYAMLAYDPQFAGAARRMLALANEAAPPPPPKKQGKIVKRVPKKKAAMSMREKKPVKRRAKPRAKPAPKPLKEKSDFIRRAESLESYHERQKGRVEKLKGKVRDLRDRRSMLDKRIADVEHELLTAQIDLSEAIGMAKVVRRFDEIF